MTSDYTKPDCLIALDTLGTKHNAAILGIAALRFDLDQPDLGADEFYLPVSLASNTRAHRRIEPGGLEYWIGRPDMEYVLTNDGDKMELYEALQQLTGFYQGAQTLWSYGRGFETAILEDAYQTFDLEPPWDYWVVKCARTTTELASWINREQVGPEINGPDLRQTNQQRLAALLRAYDILKGRKAPA